MNRPRNSATVGLVLILGGLGVAAAGCASMAIASAPDKKAVPANSEAAKAANTEFWEAFHGGRYEELPHVLDALTAVYLDNPGDAETAAHIAFAHTWRLSERARLGEVPPTITDDMLVAHKYFSEAVRLAPDDARFQGFLATVEMAEGTVHGDVKLTRRGYFDLMAAKDAWPEFNLFTAGYVMSALPITDDKYKEAVDYQWETLDLCAEERVDRKYVQYAQYMGKETQQGRKRVCWNSWIAPHNFEGFFLNMGDMLVKQGDVETARRIYGIAKLSKAYDAWPYRSILEDRITQAPENVALFRKETPGEKTRVMMIHTTFACAGCHQK
jgi:hypothetical protein